MKHRKGNVFGRIGLLMSMLLLLGEVMHVTAVTSGEVKQQQQETQSQLDAINSSISTIEGQRSAVESQITDLDSQLVETMLTLDVIEVDLENKQGEIDQAQIDYAAAKQKEDEEYQAMKERIQFIYENGDTDYAALLIESENMADFVSRVDLVQSVYECDRELLTQYQKTRQQVAELEQTLLDEKDELLALEEDYQTQKSELDSSIEVARTQVSDFDTKLAAAQTQALAYKTTIKEQSSKIKVLEAQEEAARKDQLAAQKKASDNSLDTTSKSADSESENESLSNDTTSTDSNTTEESSSSGSSSGNGGAIASYACRFVGNPYVAGGTSLTDGADCSGFTMAVFSHFGISIPRTSGSQAAGGTSVSLGSLQAGDIIYYGGHVAIYIGNGQVVHASTAATGIKISNYTYRTPICARRYW